MVSCLPVYDLIARLSKPHIPRLLCLLLLLRLANSIAAQDRQGVALPAGQETTAK